MEIVDTKLFSNYLIATKQAGLCLDGVKTKIEQVCIALKYLGYKKKPQNFMKSAQLPDQTIKNG